MAWKPRLATAQEQKPANNKLWVAIAEENAAEAVKLFVATMKNQRYPIKVRMEAATRLVMIAGATFRGEKLDAQGRPAANLPGAKVTKLENQALRAVLRELPPGSVVADPSHVKPGEAVVVLNDGYHSQKPAGHVAQAVVGKLIEQPADAPQVDEELRAEAAKAVMSAGKPIEELPPPPPPSGPALDVLSNWFGHLMSPPEQDKEKK